MAAVKSKPHTPALHVRVLQKSSVPEQSVGSVQPTQWPVLSQTSDVPHAVPESTGGFDGTPAVQRSEVQGLLSTGTLVLSIAETTLPIPSHWLTWQVPLVCMLVLVPCAAKALPQTWDEQVTVAQSELAPVQSEAALHSTQAPLPSQTPAAHVVLMGSGTAEGTPLVHVPMRQGFVGIGRSLSSATMVSWPMPSHTGRWQSPGMGSVEMGPCGTGVVAQAPFVHATLRQALGEAGQSDAVLQAVVDPPVPLELVELLLELGEPAEPPVPGEPPVDEPQLSTAARERKEANSTTGIQGKRTMAAMVRHGRAGEERGCDPPLPYPLTQITWRSVWTISTRSFCARITSSMLL